MLLANVPAKDSNVSTTLGLTPRKLCWSAAIALTTLIGAHPAAQAADFNFTYAPDVSYEQMLGFETAGQIWSDYLTDDVTINIFVEMTDMLPENVLGGALPGVKSQQSYGDFWDAVEQDITTEDDAIAHDGLQSTSIMSWEFGSDYDVMVNGQMYNGNFNMKMTTANAKALGLRNGEDTALDGYILMSNLTESSVDWDYDYSRQNPAQEGTLDFLSVALHEIGHTLGFISSVDQPGWMQALTTATDSSSSTNESDDDDDTNSTSDFWSQFNQINQATPLDMFRTSSQSTAEQAIDLSIGGNPFFSIDGGLTNLANFASGQDTGLGGDGYQGSHWQQQSSHLGIMDPILNAGHRREMSDLDMRAIDIMGWDLQSGGTDLATLHAQAKEQLAQSMGESVAWMEANPEDAALLLTPTWVDADDNALDDRGQQLHDMVVSSETYEWGWSGYWWGWSGYWWGWSGYWQEQGDLEDLSETGFWQNFSWQTGDLPAKDTQADAASVPEPTSILGLLGLGGLGLGSLFRRRSKGIASK